MTDNSQPQTKEELLSLIAREWDLLLSLVAKLDEKQMTTPDAGGWSPKDNLAHLAQWMNILLGYHLDNRPSHEVIGVTPDVTENWDYNRINQVLLERNRDRSVEDVLGELKSIYARVVDRLKSTPFGDLLKPRWPEEKDSPSFLWAVIANTSEHFAEHRETIEKALTGGELG
jgi:hypothetical protein